MIISKVQQRAGELSLGGVDFGIFTATYEAEMSREGGGDPVLAAQLAGDAWLKAKKPLVKSLRKKEKNLIKRI